MTDKEKIRAEIEKKIKVLSPFTHQGSDTCGKVIRQLESLVSFIDSLPEESVNENRREAILKKAHELAKKAELIKGDLPKSTIVALAVDMAEWCDSHPIKEPVSEDLEEAAISHAATGEFLDNGKEMIDFQKEKSFKAGAQWKEKRIIEKVCEWIEETNRYSAPTNFNVENFKAYLKNYC